MSDGWEHLRVMRELADEFCERVRLRFADGAGDVVLRMTRLPSEGGGEWGRVAFTADMTDDQIRALYLAACAAAKLDEETHAAATVRACGRVDR